MANKQNIYLSVIIPAYNEEKRLTVTLKSVFNYLKKQKYNFEVIVADDASTDGTRELVKKLQPVMPNLKLYALQENKGKGYTIRQVMLAALGEYRLFMDADNSTTLDHLDNFWPYFKEGYDVVIGSIEVEGAQINEDAGWHRRLLGHAAKLLIRLVALPGIKDSQRGFKCFTRKAALSIFPKQIIERWGFDIEVLLIARRQGFKIKELPVKWDNRGESKVGLSAYITTLLDLFKIKFNDLAGKYK